MPPNDLPVSTSIVMRPVWKRRQRRTYMHHAPGFPTADEIRDAIKVLALPDAMLAEMPAVHTEAMRIMDDYSGGDT